MLSYKWLIVLNTSVFHQWAMNTSKRDPGGHIITLPTIKNSLYLVFSFFTYPTEEVEGGMDKRWLGAVLPFQCTHFSEFTKLISCNSNDRTSDTFVDVFINTTLTISKIGRPLFVTKTCTLIIKWHSHFDKNGREELLCIAYVSS